MRQLTLPILLFLLSLPIPATAQQATPAAPVVPQARPQITLTFAPLVKQVAPAVVNIYAQKKVQQRVMSPLLDDPFFRRFFENTMPPGFSRERIENSLGSGVVVRPNGVIVTSNHVIDGAQQVRVVLADHREFDATVSLADSRSDLAVLNINTKGENLPYLELKDSDDAQVGDLVLAIGDPFGVGQTVTSGIISALARTSVSTNALDYFIQTDAAINPGNSGGALVTMDGKLVGINSAIYSRDGGNLGIGFAVPSNMVRAVLNGVALGQKSLRHPWTGLGGQAVTAALAASLNLSTPAGFLINRIDSASPALKAGLKVGDVITDVNGRPVDDPESFQYRVVTLPIGANAHIAAVRNGGRFYVDIPLNPPPEIPLAERTEITGKNPLAGATVANISPATREETGLTDVEHGVVTTDVKPDSVAISIGLQPGDVLVDINGKKIASVQDVLAGLKQPNNIRGWRIYIQRGGTTMAVMVGG